MKKQGVVIALEQGNAVIRAERESSCGSCAGKSACGTLGAWEKGAAEEPQEKTKNQYDIRLPNILLAKVGDVVTVEVPDQLILQVSVMFYGLPVLAFLLFGALSFFVAEAIGFSGDLASALFGLGGAGLVWLWMMNHAEKFDAPQMVQVSSGHVG